MPQVRILPGAPTIPQKGGGEAPFPKRSPATRDFPRFPPADVKSPFSCLTPSFPRKRESRDARPNPPSGSQAGIPSGKSILPCPSPRHSRERRESRDARPNHPLRAKPEPQAANPFSLAHPPVIPAKAGIQRRAPKPAIWEPSPNRKRQISSHLPISPSFPRRRESRDARPNPPSGSQAGIPSGKSLLPCPSPRHSRESGNPERPNMIATGNKARIASDESPLP